MKTEIPELPLASDIVLSMDHWGYEQTRLYNIKQKLDKSLTVSTSDAKFLMNELSRAVFWRGMCYMMILFESAIIIGMSFIK